MKRSWLILVLIMLVTGTVSAQEPEFKLTATDTQIAQGESTYLQLVVTNARGAEREKIKGIGNFQSAYRGTSQQIKIVNGEKTVIKKYNYEITPKSAGEFPLQGVVEYQGKQQTTNQLTIKVREGKEAAEETTKQQTKDLFIKTKLSREEIYFGQKAVLEYILFSRYQVEKSGFLENIEIDNFMVNKLEPGDQKIVRINGEKYLKQKVGRVILTPMDTGQFEIPAYKFQANLSSGDGFFSSTTAKKLTTEPRKIEVLSLPKQNQPDDFSGVVGDLEVTGSFSDTSVDYGDSVTLSVTAEGNCNLDNLEEILKQDLSGVEVYQTQKNSREQIKNGSYQAEKEFEIIFVLQSGGQIEIPDVDLTYFNPQTKEYETATLGGQTLTVTGEPNSGANSADQETVTVSQITVPEKEGEKYYTLRVRKNQARWLGIGILALALITGLGAAGYRYWQSSQNQLTKIYRQLEQETEEEKICELFNQLIKEKYGLSIKANSRRQLKQQIDDQQLAADIQAVVDYFETKDEDLDVEAKIDSIYSRLS